MFVDVGVPAPPAERERALMVLSLANVGYHAVVLETTATDMTKEATPPAKVPLGVLRRVAGECRGSGSGVVGGGGLVLPAAMERLRDGSPKAFQQFTRLTIHMASHTTNDLSNQVRLRHASLRAFDLLACAPTTDDAMQFACHEMPVDIISLDLSRRLPFRLRQATLNSAVERGVVFEIGYAAALGDAHARRSVFANASVLIKLLKGRSVVLSSRAAHALQLRGVHDVVNLGAAMGLTREQAKAALTTTPRAALVHAYARAHTLHTTIAVQPARGDGDGDGQGDEPARKKARAVGAEEFMAL